MSLQTNLNPEFKADPHLIKPFFKTNTQKHTLAMLSDWLIIIACISFTILYFNPFTYLLSIFVIGAKMHGLAILMHDATHYRFLKNRNWNDRLTNWLIMYPIFSSIETYRQNHLRHHNHLNSEHDPDWVAKLGKRKFEFPKSKTEFLYTTLSYFFLIEGTKDAIWFLKRFSSQSQEASKTNQWERITFYLILFISLSLFGAWKYFLLFWVIPYLSSFFMYQYIRSVAEHYGELAYENALNSSRTVKANLLERFFIAPHNVGYHLEHHLYPGVPFYHLPQLHRRLMDIPNYARNAHITKGYLSGLLQELGA